MGRKEWEEESFRMQSLLFESCVESSVLIKTVKIFVRCLTVDGTYNPRSIQVCD